MPNTLTDALTTENEAEIIRTHGNSSKAPNSPIGSEKWLIDKADPTRNHENVLSICPDVPSIKMHMKRLQMKQRQLEHVKTSQERKTYLIVPQNGLWMSQMAS